MNILRVHTTATDHFGDVIFALFTTAMNWVGNLFASHQDDEDEGYVMSLSKRQISATRNLGKPRILDARQDRINRRNMRNLLI